MLLASGAVPRDYLVLCSQSINKAKDRPKAKLVGKQDITRASGEISQAKISEIEEDVASGTDKTANLIILALDLIREFCLNEHKYSFFQINFRDKDKHPEYYFLIQNLMDARLIHLINASISDGHKAGERSEVYMIDLSQFSGERFKKHLKILDLLSGNLVLSETGTTKQPVIGNTPLKVISILRSAPQFELKKFAHLMKKSK